MRILLYSSPFPFQKANGGKTVFLKTKQALERAGVRAELFDMWNSKLTDYDLVHCFTTESTDMWDFVRGSDVKLAVTPISWFGLQATLRSRVFRWIKRRIRKRISCPLHAYWWEDCFAFPDIFFPNSQAQADQLLRAFSVQPQRTIVAYHGVDERFSDAKPQLFERQYNLRDFVLWVGRYEIRKNPLALVRALKGTGIPLVLIGRPDNARMNWYYEQCVREADESMKFIGELDHESPLLASAYAAARVFVLPSLLEAPGLAAMEAALAGCSVAVTEVGATREYFASHVRYLNPNSLASIREAVLDCYHNGPRPNKTLQEHLTKNFLWDKVIERNVEGYHRILSS